MGLVEDHQPVPAGVLRNVRGGHAVLPANAPEHIGGRVALGIAKDIVLGQLARDPFLQRRITAARLGRPTRPQRVEQRALQRQPVDDLHDRLLAHGLQRA